ncbi:MAG: ankyrin repeat domain-containing protein [Vicinamibacterales bacterium]
MRATPFLLAAKGGDTEMMRLLARHGADVKASNGLGTTAIMAAALRDLMRARGMKADLEEDPNRYKFGVTAQ